MSLDLEVINDDLRVAHRFLPSPCAHRRINTAWMARMLRLSRSDASGVENLGGWLTTIVARVCLNVLRSRSGVRSPWACTFPTRSSAARTGRPPRMRRCWPTRSGWRCTWCWTR